jgi:arsenate reductase-like glutaredoxin family protein
MAKLNAEPQKFLIPDESKLKPDSDRIFGVMFEESQLFIGLAEAVLNEKVELLDKPISQAVKQNPAKYKGNLAKLLAKDTVRPDICAVTKSGVISVDMQQTYSKENVTNRSISYVGRLFTTQTLEKGQDYSDLKPAMVTFIMSRQASENGNGIEHIGLYNHTTKENIKGLDIFNVFVPSVIKNSQTNSKMAIYAEFWSVKNQETADVFSQKYGDTELGKGLIDMYAQAIRTVKNKLGFFEESYHYTRKDVAELEKALASSREALAKTEQGLMKSILVMHSKNLSNEEIADFTNTTPEKVKEIIEKNPEFLEELNAKSNSAPEVSDEITHGKKR